MSIINIIYGVVLNVFDSPTPQTTELHIYTTIHLRSLLR
jgi:hypothetical protein